MARVIRASWDAFDRIVGSARSRLLICSPFYSEEGLGRLFDAFPYPGGPQMTVVSRLSPSDWLSGVADPRAMLTLLETLGDEHRLIVHQRLHAKAYLADRAKGLVGSANLSSGGFDRNFEIMLDLDEPEAAAADSMIEREASSNGVSIARASLRHWVAAHESRINEIRREEPDATRLAGAQRSLDDLLGYGRAAAVAEEIPDIEDYAAWLAVDDRLLGAEIVLDRLRNLSGQNLSGHVRQSYYAVVRFLYESPQHIEPLASELDSMARRDHIYQLDDDLSRDWIRHLDEHATERGDGWDYAVLRGILPPNLGGTRSGGGGGSSTLKRMLPLVARFLRQRASG